MESVSESHAPSWHIKVHNDVYIARRTSIQSLLDYLIWIDRRYHSRKRTVGNTEAIHTEQYRLNIWISFTSSVASRLSTNILFSIWQQSCVGNAISSDGINQSLWHLPLDDTLTYHPLPMPKENNYCAFVLFSIIPVSLHWNPFTFYVFPSFVSISFVKSSLSSAGGSIFCLYLSLTTLTFTFTLNGASRFENCKLLATVESRKC